MSRRSPRNHDASGKIVGCAAIARSSRSYSASCGAVVRRTGDPDRPVPAQRRRRVQQIQRVPFQRSNRLGDEHWTTVVAIAAPSSWPVSLARSREHGAGGETGGSIDGAAHRRQPGADRLRRVVAVADDQRWTAAARRAAPSSAIRRRRRARTARARRPAGPAPPARTPTANARRLDRTTARWRAAAAAPAIPTTGG